MLNLKLPRTLLFSLFALLAFAACDNDDDDMLINEDQTIVDVIEDDARFTTLISALQQTGLDAILGDRSTDVTLFAPTDAAFDALNVDLSTLTDAELRAILLYHVYEEGVTSNRIVDGRTYLTTMSNTGPADANLTLLIEKGGSNILLNDEAAVTDPDITTENGVIHAINTVLLPLDVVGHISANADFASLQTALGSAAGDLPLALSQEDQTYTIFAPTNAAFDAVSSVVDELEPSELAAVLTYHVLPNINAVSSSLMDDQTVTTFHGENITIDILSDNTVNIVDAKGSSAQVIFTDIQGTNGVVHVIDRVLMPNDLE